MTTRQTERPVSRRTALACLGAGGLALACPAATRPAAGQASPTAGDADLVDLIRATERERLRAFVDADTDALERLHTADFQLINPGGGVLTKAEYLGGVASGEIDYVVWAPASEIVVRPYGEAAAVRYQSNTEIVVGGERIVVRNWHTDVYERRDRRWQAVWPQATAIQ